eukprot:TRINITY_DN4622_c0_g1_i2.p1 TRINITY_DN4622_c0_g1~~TRINITY_DN4622_c0_g1_i2.p1  ORF type:complete len:696 (+),score=85.66 TRINITY_DN4622_c0_g1_i2:63-2150(+)
MCAARTFISKATVEGPDLVISPCNRILQEPVTPSNVTLGLRVTRGSDWCYGNQDGGWGYVGTITSFMREGYWAVIWDFLPSSSHSYRVGWQEKFDLAVADVQQKIVLVSELAFPGTRVTQGPHWQYNIVGVCAGAEGTVIETYGDRYCSVRWDNGEMNSFRIGAHGRFDLAVRGFSNRQKCILGVFSARPGLPVSPGMQYPQDSDKRGESDVGYIIEKVDEMWKVYWPSTKSFTLNYAGIHNIHDLCYYPNGSTQPLRSITNKAIRKEYDTVVVGSNAYVGAIVRPGLHFLHDGKNTLTEGVIESINTKEKTCSVSWGTMKGVYRIGQLEKYDLVFSRQVPLLLDMYNHALHPMYAISGIRVMRGADYDPRSWGDQDGGFGQEGTIIHRSGKSGWHGVRWDNGHSARYRTNSDAIDLQLAMRGKYAIKVLDCADVYVGAIVFRGPTFKELGSIMWEEQGEISSISTAYPHTFQVSWESGKVTNHGLEDLKSPCLLLGFIFGPQPPTMEELQSRMTKYITEANKGQDTQAPVAGVAGPVAIKVVPLLQKLTALKAPFLEELYRVTSIEQNTYSSLYRCFLKSGEVAVKHYFGQHPMISSMTPQLWTEAERAWKFEHQNIIKTYGKCQQENTVYIGLEYFPSFALNEWRPTKESEPKSIAFKFVNHLCSVLKYLHDPSKNYVHCILNPNNILVSCVT